MSETCREFEYSSKGHIMRPYLFTVFHDKKNLIQIASNSHFLDKNHVFVTQSFQQFDFTKRRNGKTVAFTLHPDPFKRHNIARLFVLCFAICTHNEHILVRHPHFTTENQKNQSMYLLDNAVGALADLIQLLKIVHNARCAKERFLAVEGARPPSD